MKKLFIPEHGSVVLTDYQHSLFEKCPFECYWHLGMETKSCKESLKSKGLTNNSGGLTDLGKKVRDKIQSNRQAVASLNSKATDVLESSNQSDIEAAKRVLGEMLKTAEVADWFDISNVLRILSRKTETAPKFH
ncbi:MAG: hypothetical protein UT24_C0019G0026 [Candidatus Woesebacteria bacterium GW2011_GWB1_39_12]|uniref:Uncharacterized protein n=1 Tax=Candidatus Woesebacteria bacterium GW2011_GWB1_39_12 TaxID=1618574 RepID=A0A0G0QE37_9BACT|nr:MAG: hypothetical protein UT24_C0019G0026 [Candidatus Woesebacteria bacterium GW2011_GWB1_39_12]